MSNFQSAIVAFWSQQWKSRTHLPFKDTYKHEGISAKLLNHFQTSNIRTSLRYKTCKGKTNTLLIYPLRKYEEKNCRKRFDEIFQGETLLGKRSWRENIATIISTIFETKNWNNVWKTTVLEMPLLLIFKFITGFEFPRIWHLFCRCRNARMCVCHVFNFHKLYCAFLKAFFWNCSMP